MVSPAAFNSLFEILSKPVDFPAEADRFTVQALT